MHTKAVFRSAQALAGAGFHVLRFNFRGIGTSTGSYDEGIGEQEDVRAALDWLEERHPGLPLLAGGFSFGSFVGLRVGVEEERVRGLLGLGMPVELWDFGFLAGLSKPLLVVQGEDDEHGSGERIAEVVAGIDGPVALVRVRGADHFFNDRFEELMEAVGEYFSGGPGAESFPVLEEG
jgi:uncharacterized protein